MGHIRLSRNPSIEISLRRHAGARRISLRVSSLDGRVTMTVPRGASMAEARRFAEDKADWIVGALERRSPTMRVGPGAVLPVEGRARTVVAERRRGVLLDGEVIRAPKGREAPALRAFLGELARERLTGAVDHFAAMLGRKAGRISIRDTRSRWGSCSHAGNLNFSWRLILAPPDALRYVAAHEVAHLRHMDHSPAFWAAVRALDPGFEKPRAWLRQEGGALHRFVFE